MALTFHDLLSKFPDAKPQGKGWQALCPAHDDHNPSLSITEGKDKEGKDKASLKCFAGCDIEKILKAKG